jgi:F-type H+-transporting ATPase subunit b
MLDFSVSFFFTLVNIAVLFFALRAILFKPVTKFMESRTAKIQSEIENAAKDREDAKSLLRMYDEKMRSAYDEAAQITRKAREDAEKQAAAIIADGKAHAENIVSLARKQILAERQAAFLAFRAEAASLVVKAAGRLAGRDPDGASFGPDARSRAEFVLRELGAKD